MNISLLLDKMTNLDKIALMEKLWDDLCQDPEGKTGNRRKGKIYVF
jgi:hypothetical protein